MPDITISTHNVKEIIADAWNGRLCLTCKTGDGSGTEHYSFGLDDEGLALRLAADINAAQRAKVTPIYPADERRIA